MIVIVLFFILLTTDIFSITAMNTINYSFNTLYEFAIPVSGCFRDFVGTVTFTDSISGKAY